MKLKSQDVVDNGRIVSRIDHTLTIVSPVRFKEAQSQEITQYIHVKHRGILRDFRLVPEIRSAVTNCRNFSTHPNYVVIYKKAKTTDLYNPNFFEEFVKV